MGATVESDESDLWFYIIMLVVCILMAGAFQSWNIFLMLELMAAFYICVRIAKRCRQ